MMNRIMRLFAALLVALAIHAETVVSNPFLGVTLLTRNETTPRRVTMRIVKIDLNAPGIAFKLTEPGGTRETVRQTTLEFLEQEHAQLAVNAHFFLPFPSPEPDADLIGIAASGGKVFSGFEEPAQSYALVTDAPGLNIDAENRAAMVHRNPAYEDRTQIVEQIAIGTVVSGSAQIITDGVSSVPEYKDAEHPDGLLTPGGPGNYSNANSWYSVPNARTVAGLSEDRQTLFLFLVDRAGGSQGMTLREVAELLIAEYGVHNALNLDGGGSTTLAMEDPSTHKARMVNVSSDNPNGRVVASNLAVFAFPAPSEGAVRVH